MEQNEIQVLVEKSRRQDASAFALLVAEYQTFVFRLAFRLLCDEEEARDMVQETFLRVWLSLDKYRPEFRFSTWLYRVACNICMIVCGLCSILRPVRSLILHLPNCLSVPMIILKPR